MVLLRIKKHTKEVNHKTIHFCTKEQVIVSTGVAAALNSDGFTLTQSATHVESIAVYDHRIKTL